MRVIPVLYTCLLASCLFGCTTSLHLEANHQPTRFDGGPQPVFVTNPELHSEYKILKASRIYKLTTEPNCERKLTLHEVTQGWRCGNPLLVAVFTIGIIPALLPGAYTFEYDLQENGSSQKFVHPLPIYERFSIWEWPFKLNQQRIFDKALAYSTPWQPSNQAMMPKESER